MPTPSLGRGVVLLGPNQPEQQQQQPEEQHPPQVQGPQLDPSHRQ